MSFPVDIVVVVVVERGLSLCLSLWLLFCWHIHVGWKCLCMKMGQTRVEKIRVPFFLFKFSCCFVPGMQILSCYVVGQWASRVLLLYCVRLCCFIIFCGIRDWRCLG